MPISYTCIQRTAKGFIEDADLLALKPDQVL